MADPRLNAGVLVSALIRRVQAAGGFAAVLQRGDERAGAILVECVERGQSQILLERSTDLDGSEIWRESPIEDAENHRKRLEKRRQNDPDLWVIELDIADAQRFAAEVINQH